jgi:hypothetical protein
MPNNDVHPTLKTLDHWAHEGREWFNKILVFEPIREEFVRTVGWERALKMGSPDWVLGLDAPNNRQEQQALTAKLATFFKENPTAIKTQVATLSLLIQQANTACHDHGDQDQSAHAAAHETPRKIAECIVHALAAGDEEIRAAAKPPVVNLSNSARVAKSNPLENIRTSKDALSFYVLALLADRYKTPITWGAEEMAKTALYPEKSVLKSKVFNRVAACVIAASGTWGIGQRVSEMLHPQPEHPPMVQLHNKPPAKQPEKQGFNIPEAAEQASLFVGAYLLGLYFSLSWSKQKLTPEQQKIKAASLAGHISSEAGLTAANVFSSAAEGMRGVWDAVVTKQITDSILDVVVTGTTVNIAHNCLQSSKIPTAIQDKIKHQAAAVLSVFAAVGAHDTLGFMQNTLLPLYAAVYTPFVAYKGAQYVAKSIEKPKFWQNIGRNAAMVGMILSTVAGTSPIVSHTQKTDAPPSPPVQVNQQKKVSPPVVQKSPQEIKVSILKGGSFSGTLNQGLSQLGQQSRSPAVPKISQAFSNPHRVYPNEKIMLKRDPTGKVEIIFRKQEKVFDAGGSQVIPSEGVKAFDLVGKNGTLTKALQKSLAREGLPQDAATAYALLLPFQEQGVDIDAVTAKEATALQRNKDGTLTVYLRYGDELFSHTTSFNTDQQQELNSTLVIENLQKHAGR